MVLKMEEQSPDNCFHHVVGYPPSSKRRYKFVNSIDSWTCYSCPKGKSQDKDITIFNEEDIKLGLDRCGYCGKKLVPKKERVTFIECGWCGGKIIL